MAEVTEQAYKEIRRYVQENWNYIALEDTSGKEIIRLSTKDSKVNWIHETVEEQGDITGYDPLGSPMYGEPKIYPKTAILQLQIKITGSVYGKNGSKLNGHTVTKSVIYDSNNSKKPLAVESFEAFTFNTDQDELTVIHEIEIPLQS